jgi:tagatose 6-phosphate kinase
MIVTVTLNPMLDKTVSLHALHRGHIQRATRVSSIVGGKGVNVSRQLALWGRDTLATGFHGGEIGAMLGRMLDEEEIRHAFVRVSGMTREGVTYVEDDGTSTGIFEPPHDVTAGESEELLHTLRRLRKGASWVVFSGSSPCPAADDVFPVAIREAREEGVRTVLDSYGETFARGVRQGPDIVKPNREELEQTFGQRLAGEPEVIDALQRLLDEGVRTAIMTDGRRACYAASSGARWKVVPPSMETVNATGSGDTMIAGLLYGLEEGWEFERALVFGVAAGAANACRWNVANVPFREAEMLIPEVRINRLSH